jgi:hypothetical protein
MSRRTILTCLSLFAAVAFAARLGLTLHLKAWRTPAAMEHKIIAASLVGGKGFTFADWNYYGPTSVQSPPFPFLLAGFFKLHHAVSLNEIGHVVINPAAAERAYFDIMVLNALAGAALVFLTYGAARTIGAVPLAALGAAGLVAVWPTQVYAASFVQAISMITCGLMGMVILYYRGVRTGGAGAWTGYAFLAAVTALTEPVFLPALVLSGGLMLLAGRLSWGQKLRNGAILAFAVAAVIGPWAVRNHIVHDKWIPVKGSFWVNVWKGNNDFASGTDRLKMTPAEAAKMQKKIDAGESDVDVEARQYTMLDLSQKARLGNRPEAYREEIFREFALSWIRSHPKRYVQLCGIRLLKTLTVDWDNPKSLYRSYVIGRAAINVMTLAGLVVAWRQRWSLLFPAMVAACALGSYTLTVTAARFAFPFEPLQLTLGSAAIVALLPRWRWATADRSEARGFGRAAMSVAGAR